LGARLFLLLGLGLVFFQRIWNDERSLLEVIDYITHHGEFDFLRYYADVSAWLGPKHPPLVALIGSQLARLFGPGILPLRLLGFGCAILTVIKTRQTARLLINPESAEDAGLLLIAFPIFLFSGATGLMDMPFTLCYTVAIYHGLRYLGTGHWQHAMLTGLMSGVGILCRYHMLMIYPVFILFFLGQRDYRRWLLRPATFLIFLIPLILFAPWFLFSLATASWRQQIAGVAQYIGIFGFRPGGLDFVMAYIFPLFPVFLGAHQFPLLGLALYQSWHRPGRDWPWPAGMTLIRLSILILLLTSLLTLPHPRYLLPLLPQAAILMAREIADLGPARPKIIGVNIALSALLVILYGWETLRQFHYLFY
jgi:4-amino-4-deoxy-L-arabinose transferase-like glycosyltransferase